LQAVMVTGNASIEGAIAAVRGAAFAYVLKPVSPPDLLDTTRRALGQAALYREQDRLRRELERSERTHRELVESVQAFVLAMDEVIEREVGRLDRLVREFLSFAQPRPLEPRPIDVGELFTAVTGLIAPEAESVHVSITNDVARGTPAVLGEAERLRQVLLNLT